MKNTSIRLFLIFLTLLFSGVYTEGPSTCRDLKIELAARGEEIESLKLTLEEYQLASGENEDESDDCKKHETCSKCLLEKINSSCGWCILHNRCSRQENCHNSGSVANLWITGMERCPKIRAVKPPHVAARTTRMLQIIMPLPEYDGLFICSFEVLGKTLLTKGRREDAVEGGITCPSPSGIPIIPADSVHLPVEISVRIPSGPNIASTKDFIIYDCLRYTSCSECTASPFPCAWCIAGNRCTHDVDENCRNDVLVFSKAVTRPTIREGPAYCSKIIPNPGLESNDIFVHSGSKKRIYVKVENIMQFQVQSRFTCTVKGIGQVDGQLLGDTIYCDVMTFKVLDRNPVSKLPFELYWGNGSGKIDNTQNLHVVVYHCGLMASSCGECLDLPEQYKCGWCEESTSCTTLDDCGEAGWMDREQKCTKPKITSFYPKSGVLTQKTNITIKGINFGKKFKDIERVRLLNNVQDIECTPWENLFVNHSQIVCQLDATEIAPDNDENMPGTFQVKISNSFVAISEDEYHFVDPVITLFEPVKGIKSGGTFLKIRGSNLDAGSKVEAYIGDLPCNIISRDSTTILCITSPSSRTRSSEVRVMFDGEEKKSSAYFFYVEDPYIRSVKSEKGANAPTGTVSGGNVIIAEGEYFDHVPNPYIYIIVDGVEYPGDCTVESDKLMECISPRLPADVLNFCSAEGFIAFDYGFRMGDVQDVQNISLNGNFEKFRVYPGPFFMPFSEEAMTKVYTSDYLVINGRYLDTVFDENDITVHIGAEECVLRSLSHTQLVCKPPVVQPKAKNGIKLPGVVVIVHEKQEFFIGFLRYSDKE